MKQNFTDRLFCLFRRSKTICVRLRGCLSRSGASLPYRPAIRFVCIIYACCLPILACASGHAGRAESWSGRWSCSGLVGSHHIVYNQNITDQLRAYGAKCREATGTCWKRTSTGPIRFPRTGASCAAERLRVIKGAMQNGIYLSLRVTAGRRPAGSG